MKITDLTDVAVINKNGIMFEVHISKHSLFRLKITVGCLTSTYPSIHVEDTLKITVGCPLCAYPSIHFSLDEDTLEITVLRAHEHMVCCVLCGCMRVLLCDELCVVLFGVLLGGVVCCVMSCVLCCLVCCLVVLCVV